MTRISRSQRPARFLAFESLEDRKLMDAGARHRPVAHEAALVQVAAAKTGAASSSGFAVTKLVRSKPGNVLSIRGSFDPSKLTSVRFVTGGKSSQTLVVIPQQVASDSVSVLVPPLIDPKSPRSVQGNVQVFVDQKPAIDAPASTFRAYKQLQIAALPALGRGIKPGTLTRDYLQAAEMMARTTADQLDLATAAARSQGYGLDGTQAAAAVRELSGAYGQMLGQIESLLNKSVKAVDLGLVNGRAAKLDLKSLGLHDQLLSLEMRVASRLAPSSFLTTARAGRVTLAASMHPSDYIMGMIQQGLPDAIDRYSQGFRDSAKIALGVAVGAGLVIPATPAVVAGGVLGALALNIGSAALPWVASVLRNAGAIANNQPRDAESIRRLTEKLEDDALMRWDFGMGILEKDPEDRVKAAWGLVENGLNGLASMGRTASQQPVNPSTGQPVFDQPAPWETEPGGHVGLITPDGFDIGAFDVFDFDSTDELWTEEDWWFDSPEFDPFGEFEDPWDAGLPFYDPFGNPAGLVSWATEDPWNPNPGLQFNFFDPGAVQPNQLYSVYPQNVQPQQNQPVWQGPAPSATFQFNNTAPIQSSGGQYTVQTQARTGQNQDTGVRYRVIADTYYLNIPLTKIERIDRNVLVESGLRSVEEAQQAIERDKKHNIKMQYNQNYRIESYR